MPGCACDLRTSCSKTLQVNMWPKESPHESLLPVGFRLQPLFLAPRMTMHENGGHAPQIGAMLTEQRVRHSCAGGRNGPRTLRPAGEIMYGGTHAHTGNLTQKHFQ